MNLINSEFRIRIQFCEKDQIRIYNNNIRIRIYGRVQLYFPISHEPYKFRVPGPDPVLKKCSDPFVLTISGSLTLLQLYFPISHEPHKFKVPVPDPVLEKKARIRI